MKRTTLTTGVVLGLVLLLAAGAWAGSSSGSLSVADPVSVAGKQLAPGDYKVKWEGTGSNVEVSILRGKEVVATAPAHIQELSQESRSNAAVVRKNSDGSKSMTEIRFGGKKFALALGEESAQAQTMKRDGTTNK